MKTGTPHTRHAMAFACCTRTGFCSLKPIADRATPLLVGRHQAGGVEMPAIMSASCV